MKFNAAFWKWFGKSKVVDDKGQPLKVYHGSTATRPLTRFLRPDQFMTDLERMSLGIHFGTMAQAVSRIGGDRNGRIYQVYLKVDRPLSLPDLHAWYPEQVAKQLAKQGIIPRSAARAFSLYKDSELPSMLKDIVELIQDAGYDGIRYENKVEGTGESWMVFEPSQIKSAVNNDGTWDADDPDIRSNPPPRLVREAERLLRKFEKEGRR